MMLPPPGLQPQGGQQVIQIYQYPEPPAAPTTAPPASGCCNACCYYGARLVVVTLLWASWVVYAAGTSRAQMQCNTSGMQNAPFPDVIALIQQNLAPSGPSLSTECVYYFAVQWWSVFLQFGAIIAVALMTFEVFEKPEATIGATKITMFFAIMSSIQMFFICNKYNYGLYLNLNFIATNPDTSSWTLACTLVLVGTVVSLVFNFIFIIWHTHASPRGAPKFPAPERHLDAYVSLDDDMKKEKVKAKAAAPLLVPAPAPAPAPAPVPVATPAPSPVPALAPAPTPLPAATMAAPVATAVATPPSTPQLTPVYVGATPPPASLLPAASFPAVRTAQPSPTLPQAYTMGRVPPSASVVGPPTSASMPRQPASKPATQPAPKAIVSPFQLG